MLRRVLSQTSHGHVSYRLRSLMHNHNNRYPVMVSSFITDSLVDYDNNNNNNTDDYKCLDQHRLMQVREFGLYRRPHQQFDKDPDDLMADADADDNDDDDGTKLKTSDDMDFYDSLTDEFNFDDDNDDDDDDAAEEERKEEKKRQAIRDELDSRTGRLWSDPWEITDEDWMSGATNIDSIPDWTEDVVSRVSKERVKLHPDGIPTLSVMARLIDTLPSSYPPHPALGNPKPYLKYRKKLQYQAVYDAVSQLAQPQVEDILNMESWEDKQNAVDDLFEFVDSAMKEEREDMKILKQQPFFDDFVEQALEEYLTSIVESEQLEFEADGKSTEEESDNDNDEQNGKDVASEEDQDSVELEDKKKEEIKSPEPVFIDLLALPSAETDENGVPKIIHPLKCHHKDGIGRMVEEWELAAHSGTKRIMMREYIAKVADTIDKAASPSAGTDTCQRVYLKGATGIGKTAALAALVASARTSGHIVLYLPDGDRLRKLGFYTEVNSHYLQEEFGGKVLFDLPMLAQEICGQMLESHESDLAELEGVHKSSFEKFMSADKAKKLCAKLENDSGENEVVSLVSLLKLAVDNVTYSSGCYSVIIDNLMNQTQKPFTVVMDEFNCYYDHGHYFHGEYDPKVKRAIPCNRITLFKPLLDAIGVHKNDDGESFTRLEKPILMKRGSIITASTESRAVARRFSDDLEKALLSSAVDGGVTVVDIPTYSPIEVEHILANFESIGIGRLRFDRGETVMNDQEVAFLRMLSGGVGQHLLDACIV